MVKKSVSKSDKNFQEFSRREKIKKMVLAIIGQADYDLMKGFEPETAEEPEYAAQELEKIIDLAEKHIKLITKANAK